jgi:hypothetical protein
MQYRIQNTEYSIQNTAYRIQNTEYRIQNTAAAKLMYIKLPMYLFFYTALGLNDFDGGYSNFEGHWNGWALIFSIFLGPKKSPFSGPTPSNGP